MSKAAVIYWSGTGNTAEMAKAMQKGLKAGGVEDTALFEVTAAPVDLGAYDKLAFGCPSMSGEALEEYKFEPYFKSIETQLVGKKVALFGSFSWSDGEWMRNWAARVKADGAQLMSGGMINNGAPDRNAYVQYGEELAAF